MKILKYFFMMIVSGGAYAQDMNQYLPGQVQDDIVLKDENDSEYKQGQSPFLIFQGDEDVVEKLNPNVDKDSSFILSKEEQKFSDQENSLGISKNGDYEKTEQYIEFSNKKILKDIRYKTKDRLNFSLVYDSFDYKNANNSFDRVYRDSKEIDVYGMLFLSYDKFIKNGVIAFYYGGGAGVGYNGGKGVFEGESLESDTSYDERANFSFWTVPLDMRFGAELLLSHYFALSATVGPSLMVIMQHRSDREEGKKQRDRRQFSPGLFAHVNFKINFGELMNDLGFKVFSRDEVNRFYMNFEARTHSYSNFKSKDVSITGASFGLGFSYDFI